MLYLEGDTTRCPTLALRRLFLLALYHWLCTASDSLIRTLANGRGLSKVFAVELLRSPFYLCVPPHVLTVLSTEMHYYSSSAGSIKLTVDCHFRR